MAKLSAVVWKQSNMMYQSDVCILLALTVAACQSSRWWSIMAHRDCFEAWPKSERARMALTLSVGLLGILIVGGGVWDLSNHLKDEKAKRGQ